MVKTRQKRVGQEMGSARRALLFYAHAQIYGCAQAVKEYIVHCYALLILCSEFAGRQEIGQIIKDFTEKWGKDNRQK